MTRHGAGEPASHEEASWVGTQKVPGNGRVYHISFTATDPSGSVCFGEVLVEVPHDQKGDPATDDGPLFDSTIP